MFRRFPITPRAGRWAASIPIVGALLMNASSVRADVRGPEVLALDAARARALLESDLSFLEQITDEDYVHVESSGLIRDKAQLLDGVRKGAIRFSSFVIEDNRVRFFGNVAVVTGSYRNAGVTSSEPAPVKFARHTRVYVRRAVGWRNVSHQATAYVRQDIE